MSAHIIRFPARNAAAIFISEAAGGGWLVLARDHGWLHGDRRSAIRIRNGWRGISGFRCGRRHVRRLTSSVVMPGCRPIRGEPNRRHSSPKELRSGDQRRPQCRCRQGHLVRRRGQGRRRRGYRLSQARGRAGNSQWLKQHGFSDTDDDRSNGSRSSRPTTTPTNSACCYSRSAASSRSPFASGAGHDRTIHRTR